MFDAVTGLPKTAHTTNPVELIYVGADYKSVKLRSRGILADIAPTVLRVLGVDGPAAMTATSLIES